MSIKKIIQFLRIYHNRNQWTFSGKKTAKHQVNVEYWQDKVNIGDSLAPIIVDWLLSRRGIDINKKINHTVHLLTIGSILVKGKIPPDAVVWGSGIHHLQSISKIARYEFIVKRDIRAVRGPITGQCLRDCGYNCPSIYADPAILMPLIYYPGGVQKRYNVSFIPHINRIEKYNHLNGINILSPQTDDYKYFIKEILSSKMIISSSLHGIILSEVYGIPAVFLNDEMDNELLKYYDYYFSTNRKKIKIAYNIEDAMNTEPLSIPNFELQTNQLLDSFPYDLWE